MPGSRPSDRQLPTSSGPDGRLCPGPNDNPHMSPRQIAGASDLGGVSNARVQRERSDADGAEHLEVASPIQRSSDGLERPHCDVQNPPVLDGAAWHARQRRTTFLQLLAPYARGSIETRDP